MLQIHLRQLWHSLYIQGAYVQLLEEIKCQKSALIYLAITKDIFQSPSCVFFSVLVETTEAVDTD